VADYGHDLLFGTFLTPNAAQAERVVALAELTEQVGLDLVSVQDHPYNAKFLDTWTLLSVIAARTSTVRVTPNVANLPLRSPAMLGRAVASLDLLTGGRVELGLGAGAFWDGIAALGGPRLSPSASVEALAEGIEIIRALWEPTGTVKVDGKHHRVWGAHAGPAPAHDVGIWIGAYKARMLALTGRLGDGWLPSSPYAPPSALTAMNAAIDAAALEAGREPAAVRRLYNIAGSFRGNGFLQGPPAVWAEQLAELTVTEGMSGYLVMGDDPEFIRRFAGEVVPDVKERVASARGPTVAAPVTREVERVEVALPRGLGVTPTPDDGHRHSAAPVWDESERPVGPTPDADRTYTPHEAATAQHLIDVHDHLRGELEGIRQLVEQVAAGALTPGAARGAINQMTMRQNNWTLGAYCESYCRLVTTHHTLEDITLFPRLRAGDPALRPVVDRLEHEHKVIHEVLEGVDRALVALVSEPGGMKRLREAVDQLTDALLSHLSYEERELVEPIARLGLN
jgi:alkanesulfonate monooxygenase SsuD/methylene tetrahydromethanopterin reductase-like flavin-dependent oxidoreductase (luciferase family)